MPRRLVPRSEHRATLDGAEANLPFSLPVRCKMRRLDQVEIVVIPHIHLADPPATLEGLGQGGTLAPHDGSR